MSSSQGLCFVELVIIIYSQFGLLNYNSIMFISALKNLFRFQLDFLLPCSRKRVLKFSGLIDQCPCFMKVTKPAIQTTKY